MTFKNKRGLTLHMKSHDIPQIDGNETMTGIELFIDEEPIIESVESVKHSSIGSSDKILSISDEIDNTGTIVKLKTVINQIDAKIAVEENVSDYIEEEQRNGYFVKNIDKTNNMDDKDNNTQVNLEDHGEISQRDMTDEDCDTLNTDFSISPKLTEGEKKQDRVEGMDTSTKESNKNEEGNALSRLMGLTQMLDSHTNFR